MSENQAKRELDFVSSAGNLLTPEELDQSASLLARWIFDSQRIDSSKSSSRVIEPNRSGSKIKEVTTGKESS